MRFRLFELSLVSGLPC